MFEQTFKNIDDTLRKDAGCSTELDYVPELLQLKYQGLEDAKTTLGSVEIIRKAFIDFRKYLYVGAAA